LKERWFIQRKKTFPEKEVSPQTKVFTGHHRSKSYFGKIHSKGGFLGFSFWLVLKKKNADLFTRWSGCLSVMEII